MLNKFEHAGVSLAVHGTFSESTMVFQHGLCGAANQPAAVFPKGQGVNLVTMDCRGHGASEVGPISDLSIACFAADLVALIEAKAKDRIILGGISMGAAIALKVAVKRPDLICGLVLARPAWLLSSAPANMSPNAEVAHLIASKAEKARASFNQSYCSRLLEERGPENLKSIQGFFKRKPLDVTAALLTKISDDGPRLTYADVASISVPSLVIGHDKDYIHPLDYAIALAAMIPDANLVQIVAKAESADKYKQSFRVALANFLKELV